MTETAQLWEQGWSKPRISVQAFPSALVDELASSAFETWPRPPALAYTYVSDGREFPAVVVKRLQHVESARRLFRGMAMSGRSFSVFFDDLDQVVPELERLRARIDGRLVHRRFDVAGSWSVAGSSVGFHADDKDSLIVQLAGQRRWRVWEPDALSPVLRFDVLSHRNEHQYPPPPTREPAVELVLQPGDALAIPAGWPHLGVTLGQSPSISLSIQWMALSPMSFLVGADALPPPVARAVREQEPWLTKRLRDPVGTPEIREQYRAMLSERLMAGLPGDVEHAQRLARDRTDLVLSRLRRERTIL